MISARWTTLTLAMLLSAPGAVPQAQIPRKDIPTLARRAVKAVVLVQAWNEKDEVTQGSGFVISADGKVVTNHHVIEKAKSAIIKFENGAFYLVEGVLASDKSRDVVILKASGKDFPVLPIGDSGSVEIGEEVVAIGSPLAFEATVSNGIISAVRGEEGQQVFQITAPISPGSSGGALLNTRGEVIAITTASAPRGQNINFAVPINYVKPLLSAKAVAPLPSQEERQEKASEIPADLPAVWTNLVDGEDYQIRFLGQFGYAEWIPSEAMRPYKNAGAFARCEFKPAASAGIEWIGRCWYRWPLCFRGGQATTNLCQIEIVEIIKSLTPTRIEGEGAWPDPDGLDCGKCTFKRMIRVNFVLIPKPVT
jgi:hypothetical protein